MKTRNLNMTEGNVFKLLLTFAIPMLIGNLFQQVYNLADSIIVGKMIGSDALAAVGATGSVTFLFFALCNGISNGGGVVTAQNFGGGEPELVRKSILNTAYVMLVLPSLIGLIAFISTRPLLVFLNTPESILEDSVSYMHIMCVGIIFVSLYNYISAMLRALGDSRTPLYFLILSCVLNTCLDITFVKLGFGVRGAALATIFSQFTAGLGSVLFALKTNPYFKFKLADAKPEKAVLLRILKIGVPMSLQFGMIAISCMALQRVVNSFGATAVATFTATSRVDNIVSQPYMTLSNSLSTYTGQNFGAKKRDRIVEGYRKGLLTMAVFTLILIPIIQLCSTGIMKAFVDDPEVIEMGARALKITSMFYLFLGSIYATRGVMNGLGDAFFSLLNGIVEVVGRFTVPIIITGIASIGLWGIWWSSGIVWFISGATAWARYMQYGRKVIRFDK